MSNDLFAVLPKMGRLYFDKILFESNYPVLFTCRDMNMSIYLCVCHSASGGLRKWLMTRVEAVTVISLLKDEITIREAFISGDNVKYSVHLEDNTYHVDENNVFEWDEQNSSCLPSEGEYMDAEEGEYDEIIEYYADTTEYICSVDIDNIFHENAWKRITIPADKYVFNNSREVTLSFTSNPMQFSHLFRETNYAAILNMGVIGIVDKNSSLCA